MYKRVDIKQNKVLYVALCLLVFSLPLTELLKQVTIGIIIIFGLYHIYKNKIKIKKDSLFFSFLGLVIAFSLSNVLSENIFDAFNESKYIFRLFLLFIVLRTFSYESKSIRNIMYSVFFGYTIALFWAYYDFIQMGFNRLFLKLHSIGHINHTSIYMLYIFVLLLTYALSNKHFSEKFSKVLIYTLLLATLVTIFITASRATMYTSIGIIILIFAYNVIFNKNYKILYVLIPLIISAYLVLEYNSLSIAKFERGFEDSARIKLILSGIQGWYESGNYLFGVGSGNYSFGNHSHAHNTYINILFENGLAGLIFYLIFMFSIMSKLLQKIKETNVYYLIIASILLWIANFVISFANTTFHHENALLLIVIWVISLNFKKTKEKKDVKLFSKKNL